MRVLLVDDSENLLELFKMYFELDDVTVVTAHNGIEALAELSRGKLDAIICDVNMPSMNGLDLYKALKLKNLMVPFCFLTGDALEDDPELKELAQRENIKVFCKPVLPEDLADFVKNIERRA